MTLWLLIGVTWAAITGCAVNYGQPLSQQVSIIIRQQTIEEQIRAAFGEPIQIRLDLQQGIKILTYRYQNNDGLQKVGATLGSSILGGIFGYQIGGGSGQALSTSLGTMVGGALGSNTAYYKRGRTNP